MGFLLGFFCGIVFTLAVTPLLIKYYIRKKINVNDLTGGLLQ